MKITKHCCAVALFAWSFTGLSGCGEDDDPAGTGSSSDQVQVEVCDADWRTDLFMGTNPADEEVVPSVSDHATALPGLNVAELTNDLNARFTDSHACWPADFGNYGPMFVRLAWHCAGSYRDSDQVGGCGGGRIRFEPERSWDDNTNLDKARALLSPIKMKYGAALSWGDLFIAAGTAALKSMGAPLTRMCFGRIDETDGSNSINLGPSTEQQAVAPCWPDNSDVNYACQAPLGGVKVGLIYVNPEGVVSNASGSPDPNPTLLVADIRDTFERMGHSDTATVALIGGGHAIGKCHGASTAGPGTNPRDTFQTDVTALPWSAGSGANTVTAGFEGPWTTTPLVWSNEFYDYLVNRNWVRVVGPGGKSQWEIDNPATGEEGLMRLTSDMALLEDTVYAEIVNVFATNMQAFNNAFDHAWDDLTILKGSGAWSSAAFCDDNSSPTVSPFAPWPVPSSGPARMLDSDAE